VRKLEERCSAVLVHRTRNLFETTAAGALLLPHARRVLEAACRLELALAPRRLTVGAASNPGIYLLPPPIEPGGELRLGSNPETLGRLEAGDVDLAVTE
jgi:DNA-binding transcriptional LysR family regulator